MSRKRRPNFRVVKTPHEIIFEFVRPVSDDKGDFEETLNYVPTLRDLRESIRDELETIGVGRRQASRFFVFMDSVEFLEFDSSNASHACGYWEFKAAGPKHLVDELLKEGD